MQHKTILLGMLLALATSIMLVQPGMAQTNATATKAKTHTIEWIERDTPFANVTACKNNKDQVVFTWPDDGESLHNIVVSNSTGVDICDKPGKELLGMKTSATYNLNITALKPGNYGYICTVGGHCTFGNMNVVVIVKNC